MRLYVVMNKKNDTIDAHTRDKEAFDKYIENLNRSKFKTLVLDTEKGDKKTRAAISEYIKRIEAEYVDRTMSFLLIVDPEVVREGDREIHSFAAEEYAKLKLVRNDLKSIIKNYDIDKDEKKKLKKALEVIEELSKKKRFEKAIGFNVVKNIVKNSPLIDLKRIFNFKGEHN